MLLRVNYRLGMYFYLYRYQQSLSPARARCASSFISRMPLKKNTLKLGTRARPNARVREAIHTRRAAVYTRAAPTRN
jgi:hypothetical protein